MTALTTINEGEDVTATAGNTTTSVEMAAGTEYVVLRRESDGRWQLVKTVTARTPENAVKAAHKSGGDAVVYVAVPSRSWKPVKVRSKVETTLLVEAVGE